MPSSAPLNIKDPEAAEAVRRLAEMTGESITRATLVAARERLARIERSLARSPDAIDRIIEEGRSRRIIDDRTADEVVGYDDNGLPT